MKNKIKKINTLLKKQFGIPPRPDKFPDPLSMTIGTILSQNTNDRNSYKAFSTIKEKYKSWDEILNVPQKKLENQIKVAGLGFQKSKSIKGLLARINKEEKEISLDFVKDLSNEKAIEYLTSYDGIGVKTASCVLLFSLDKNICPVDTHLHRTLNRIGLVKASSPDKTFEQINSDFPDKIAHQFHTNLIRLGREICKPKNPACGACPIKKNCNFTDKNEENTNISDERSFMLLDHID